MNGKLKYILTAIAALVLSLVLILPIINLSLAWIAYVNSVSDGELMASSLVNYYHAGDGSEDDPFIITTAGHLYNLIWLQNRGFYDNATFFFEIGDEDHPTSEIDMAGMLADRDGNTGAVPPIGTATSPFRGSFDGNGCVIKNLWVSTDSEDWAEKPISITEAQMNFSTGVGFFGNIKRPENDTTSVVYAGNFILQNIEVTTTLASAQVGLVAGSVDAAMSKIGVKNGIITVKDPTGATIPKTVNSGYVLVGDKSSGTIWSDIPGSDGGSGDLVIAPLGLKDENGNILYNKFTTVPANTVDDVDGCVPGTANYVAGASAISLTSIKPVPDTFKVHNVTHAFDNTINSSNSIQLDKTVQYYTANKANPKTPEAEQLDLSASSLNNNDSVLAYRDYTYSTNRVSTLALQGIKFTTPPTFTNGVQYPKNCIWFKPQNSGTCYISFAPENQSSFYAVSVYKFKKSASNVYTDIHEVEFQLWCDNGTAVLFELEITDTSYEYAIGRNSDGDGNAASFLFLTLAGTNTKPSSSAAEAGLSRLLYQVEFITADKTLATAYPANDADYTPLKSHLSITDLAVAAGSSLSLRFNNVSGIVNYSNNNVTEHVDQANRQSTYTADPPENTTVYPRRVTSKPQTQNE